MCVYVYIYISGGGRNMCVCVSICISMYVENVNIYTFMREICGYEVATISMLLKSIGLFCRISSLL